MKGAVMSYDERNSILDEKRNCHKSDSSQKR